jgi:hypothetical protein
MNCQQGTKSQTCRQAGRETLSVMKSIDLKILLKLSAYNTLWQRLLLEKLSET